MPTASPVSGPLGNADRTSPGAACRRERFTPRSSVPCASRASGQRLEHSRRGADRTSTARLARNEGRRRADLPRAPRSRRALNAGCVSPSRSDVCSCIALRRRRDCDVNAPSHTSGPAVVLANAIGIRRDAVASARRRGTRRVEFEPSTRSDQRESGRRAPPDTADRRHRAAYLLTARIAHHVTAATPHRLQEIARPIRGRSGKRPGISSRSHLGAAWPESPAWL